MSEKKYELNIETGKYQIKKSVARKQKQSSGTATKIDIVPIKDGIYMINGEIYTRSIGVVSLPKAELFGTHGIKFVERDLKKTDAANIKYIISMLNVGDNFIIDNDFLGTKQKTSSSIRSQSGVAPCITGYVPELSVKKHGKSRLIVYLI